jgi:hypothetical protein
MDVIVSLAQGSTNVWNLTDRLGRNVGQIVRTTGNEFVITPASTWQDAPLSKTDTSSLNLHAQAGSKKRRCSCHYKEEPMTPEQEVRNREERIRLRALEIWREEGCPEGRAQEHWAQA